jgi:hypothetical protein
LDVVKCIKFLPFVWKVGFQGETLWGREKNDFNY